MTIKKLSGICMSVRHEKTKGVGKRGKETFVFLNLIQCIMNITAGSLLSEA